MYLFVPYQAKSHLKLCSPWDWSAARKELSTIVLVEKRRLGMLKPQKGWRIKARNTQDIVVTLYLWGDAGIWNSSWETSCLFEGKMGQPLHWTHFALLSVPSCSNFSGILPHTHSDFGPFACLDVCTRVSQNCSSDNQDFQCPQAANQASQKQVCSFLSQEEGS